MPGFDNTGPMGNGPMTGGGRGRCSGIDVGYGRPYFRDRGMNRGVRYGRGYGRGGWRSSVSAPYPIQAGDEIYRLKEEAEFIKNDLDRIHRQIADLEKTQTKE